jgi:hypothetical protein
LDVSIGKNHPGSGLLLSANDESAEPVLGEDSIFPLDLGFAQHQVVSL